MVISQFCEGKDFSFYIVNYFLFSKLILIFVVFTLKNRIMTTYSTTQITQFLIGSKYEYAATCWSSDYKQERVTWLEASNWFQKYFIDKNIGRYLFRLMECECVAHMTFQ